MQLAAWLPEHADSCVVVRPGRVPARRRALALRQSQAGGDPWDAALGVAASAQAHIEHRDGRRATRKYLRFESTSPPIRERLRGLRIRWDEDECEGLECRLPVARFMDERTIEIARHEWPRREARVSTSVCVALARRHPEAVEVSARSGLVLAQLEHARSGSVDFSVGSVVERVVVGGPRGLALHYLHTYASPAEARFSAEWLETHVFDSLSPLAANDERTIEQEGRVVHVRDFRRWSELELANEDDRILRAAQTHLRGRAEPLAVSRVDVSNLTVVRHQVRLRSAELERRTARGPARRAMTEALAELLRRSFEAHPAELWLATRLARLDLDENERPDAALALVEGVLATDLAEDPSEWRTLRREALAHGGPEPLRAALVEDGIATGEEAARAAEDLVRLRGASVSYEWAEGAWRLSREMRVREVTATSGTLSRGGVIGSLVALAQWGSTEGHGTLQVAVFTPSALETAVVGRTTPELVVVRAAAGGSVIIGAAPTLDLLETRRLAGLIDQLVPTGEVSYVVQLGDPVSGRSIRVRLDGTASSEAFTIRRSSPALRATPWSAVQRYLARPLHDAPIALFPPPTITIRAESPEIAAEIRREADLASPGACQLSGPYVRCRAPGRPESLGALLLGLARARISAIP